MGNQDSSSLKKNTLGPSGDDHSRSATGKGPESAITKGRHPVQDTIPIYTSCLVTSAHNHLIDESTSDDRGRDVRLHFIKVQGISTKAMW